jgi:hypothetical protein
VTGEDRALAAFIAEGNAATRGEVPAEEIAATRRAIKRLRDRGLNSREIAATVGGRFLNAIPRAIQGTRSPLRNPQNVTLNV